MNASDLPEGIQQKINDAHDASDIANIARELCDKEIKQMPGSCFRWLSIRQKLTICMPYSCKALQSLFPVKIIWMTRIRPGKSTRWQLKWRKVVRM